jgi:ABC-type Fe3+/spermidine/putrescine transport system ATPase subunit
MTFLTLTGIQKAYQEGNPVIQDFSISVPKGQILGLIGESGSGKSTLLKIIAGLENREQGEVFLDGQRVKNPKETLVPGHEEIQLVHQEYQLYPNSTVAENIGRPLLLFDQDYRQKRLEFLLDLFGLQLHKNKLPRQLSGGQQQKVAIARALSMEPKVLLLDEPFSSLDSIQTRELIDELREMFRLLDVTVLFVTHELTHALQLSDELLILRKGKIIQKGYAEKLYAKPKSVYAAKLFSHLNSLPEKPRNYIRPSAVKLLRSNGIPAKVIHKIYLASHNQLTVSINHGQVHWIVEDRFRKFEVGERIFLKYNDADVLIF